MCLKVLRAGCTVVSSVDGDESNASSVDMTVCFRERIEERSRPTEGEVDPFRRPDSSNAVERSVRTDSSMCMD